MKNKYTPNKIILSFAFITCVMCLILIICDNDSQVRRSFEQITDDGWHYTILKSDQKEFAVITGYSGEMNVDEISMPGEINGTEVQYYCDSKHNTMLKANKLIIPYQIREITGYGLGFSTIKCIEFESYSHLDKIGEKSTLGVQGLEELTLPDSIETIEEEAFAYAFNLRKVYLGKNIKSIKDGVFYNTALSEVVISPENKRFIYDEGLLIDKEENRLIAYDHERYQDKITVPSTIKSVDARCFDGHLRYIDVEEGNTDYKSINGCLYSENGKTLIKVPNDMEELLFADGVDEIGSYSMRNCIFLKDIEVPDSVKRIDSFAFDSINVYLPESIESVNLTYFTGNIYYQGNPDQWKDVSVENPLDTNQYELHFMGE